MTPPTPTPVRIDTIPADRLQAVRDSGRDVSGTPVAPLVASGGEPLRCCLRDARTGDECLLFGYEPPIPGGPTPYREIGAVYTHAHPCGGPNDDGYPSDWRTRPQVLRAYDNRGWIHPATTTHDGTDPAGALRAVLTTSGVVAVHSRNIAHGCFMFAATLGWTPGAPGAVRSWHRNRKWWPATRLRRFILLGVGGVRIQVGNRQ